MTKKISVTMVIISLLVSVSMVAVPLDECFSESNQYSFEKVPEENDSPAENQGYETISIYASAEELQKALCDTSDIKLIGEWSEADLIVLNAEEAEFNGKEVQSMVDQCSKFHIPMIVLGDNFEDVDKLFGIKVCMNVAGINVKGYYVDETGLFHTYTVSGDDLSGSIEQEISWANELINSNSLFAEERIGPSRNMNTGVGSIVLGYQTHTENYERGSLTLTTCVSMLTGIADQFNDYFTIHFIQNGAPNTSNNIRLGDLWLNASMVSGTMHKAEPTTTVGSSTTQATVNLGLTVGYDGTPYIEVGAGASGSWSYTISDVEVVTTFTDSSANVWHDVSEDKTVGLGYSAEPGLLFSAPKYQGASLNAQCKMNTYVKNNHLFWTSYDNGLENSFIANISVQPQSSGNEHLE